MNTIEKINEFQKFGSVLGLERIKKLTDLLDSPQEGLNYIHVGGTNGKGSVSKYVYSILKANGYTVGMFTSPFMDGFREAIIVDDIAMSGEELDSYYRKIESAIALMKKDGYESPTEFEVITVLALLYFKDKKPDFVIMEVGLGGIGDSTNIIGLPLLSVITSVSLDHCDVLGDTIEQIAREKSGIIKKGVPVIVNTTDPTAAKVIAKEAYEKKAPLINAVKYKPAIIDESEKGSRFSLNIDGINYPEMEIGMGGTHQVTNAVCALTVIEYLRKKAMISLDRGATLDGLKNAKLKGRFEIISGNPQIILDGAHNSEGAKALAVNMKKYFSDKKILTVFSLMKDKDPVDVVNSFLEFSDEIIIADILEDKPIDAKGLAKLSESVPSIIITDRDQFIDTIKGITEYDIVLITGSLYLIRNIRTELIDMSL